MFRKKHKFLIVIFIMFFAVYYKWGIADIVSAGDFLTSTAKDEFLKVLSYYDEKFKKLAGNIGSEYSTELLHTIISSDSLCGNILSTFPHITFGIETAVGFIPSERIFSDIGLFDEPPIPSVPTPYIGFMIGTGFFDKFDLRLKYFTLPKLSYFPSDLTININYFIFENRYKIFDRRAFLPDITAGLTLGYSYGKLSYPYSGDGVLEYSESYFNASGSYKATISPEMSWKLLSLGLDIRFAWSFLGIIKPFLGFGIGINGGEMTFKETIRGDFDITIQYTDDTLSGSSEEVSDTVEISSSISKKPATFINYWSLGFELNLFLIKFGFLMSINMYNKAGSVGFSIIFSL